MNWTREILLESERVIRSLLYEARGMMIYTKIVVVKMEKKNIWICEALVRFLNLLIKIISAKQSFQIRWEWKQFSKALTFSFSFKCLNCTYLSFIQPNIYWMHHMHCCRSLRLNDELIKDWTHEPHILLEGQRIEMLKIFNK